MHIHTINNSTPYRAVVFPIVMYECERWTIKKAKHWKTDAVKLCFWERLLRVPWTARRLNKSILREINTIFIGITDTEAEELWYFGQLMRRADSLAKVLSLHFFWKKNSDSPLLSTSPPSSIFPSIRVFYNESVLHIRWPKYWGFSFSISPFNEYAGLISFRIDWFDLLAVQMQNPPMNQT